jgi:hypothetical protein
MNVLDVMREGSLAAAELLALLLVTPVSAADRPAVESPAYERPLQLHRLAAAGDTEVLGALAQARVTQQGTGDSASLPSMRAGHVQLTEDEAVADAALIGALSAPDSLRSRAMRVKLPPGAGRSEPRALLVDRNSQQFVAVVPHRTVAAATLVLRPAAGAAEMLDLGPLDPQVAVLVPLATHEQLDALDDGVIELEFDIDGGTVWTTLAARRVDGDPIHADSNE